MEKHPVVSSKQKNKWNCIHLKEISIPKQKSRFSNAKFKKAVEKKQICCDNCSVNMPDVWACFGCTFLGCGRRSNKHLLLHFEKYFHPVCINIAQKMVWCYECDKELVEEECINKEELKRLQTLRSFVSNEKMHKTQERVPPRRISHKSKSKIKGKYQPGVCGLYNMGNTCYMNAALQSLSNCPPLVYYFIKQAPYEASGKRARLAVDFSYLLADMWSGECKTMKPTAVVHGIKRSNPIFRGYGQQDSQEFIRSLLDLLDEGLKQQVSISTGSRIAQTKSSPKKRKKNVATYRSIISDLFKGMLVSRVKCLQCSRVSTKQDPFFDLSLSIPDQRTLDRLTYEEEERGIQSYSDRRGGGGFTFRLASWMGLTTRTVALEDCLAAFCTTEILKGADRYKCDHCKKLTKSEKRFTIGSCPDVLCITIKRFKYDSYFGSKLSDHVQFPLRGLDVGPYCDEERERDGNTVYDLAAIVNHRGSLNGGHYVAYAVNGPTRRWLEFDDSYVSRVSEDTVAGVEAYVLFYLKRNEQSVEEREKVENMIKEWKKSRNSVEEYDSSGNGGSDSVWISKRWYHLWKAVSSPGPIEHTQACPHGFLHLPPTKKYSISSSFKEKENSRAYKLIPLTAWEILVHSHTGGPIIRDLSYCEICEEEELILHSMRKEQKKEISTRDRTYLKKGGSWCLIHAPWLASWHSFISGGPLPGPISNIRLLDKHNNPKKNLEPVKHYRGVVPKVWEYLHTQYGGGPLLLSPVIDIYQAKLSTKH